MSAAIPLTILAGFLGAGKTTLLQYILHETHGKRILVVQNEFSDQMGIESAVLVDKKGKILTEMYELPNGYELVGTLDAVLKSRPNEFDYVIVETSGVADPAKVISTFWVDDVLESKIVLDGVVTVVDALNINRYLHISAAEAEETLVKGEDHSDLRCNLMMLRDAVHDTAGPTGKAPSALSRTAVNQVICGSVILLNKCDLVTDDNVLDNIESVVQSINADAKILRCSKGKVALDEILHLKDFGGYNNNNRPPLEPQCSKRLNEVTCASAHHICTGAAKENLDMNVNNCFIEINMKINLKAEELGARDLTNDDDLESRLKECKWEIDDCWNVANMNSIIGSLLWDDACGKIYRCKGLFACLGENEEGNEDSVGIYSLQGVAELFTIEKLSEGVILNLLQNKTLTKCQDDGDGCCILKCRFLFIGENLHPLQLRQKLERQRT